MINRTINALQPAGPLNRARPVEGLRPAQPDTLAYSMPVSSDLTGVKLNLMGEDVTSETRGNKPRLRILLVASAGGHWIELCRMRRAFAGHDCQYVSTSRGLASPDGVRDVLVVEDSSRDTLFASLRTLAGIWRIVRGFQPDLVVSTGAAPGAAALFAAKLCGARTIWIDSIANGDELSLSGKLVRPVADLRLTQNEDIANRSKKIGYFGRVM